MERLTEALVRQRPLARYRGVGLVGHALLAALPLTPGVGRVGHADQSRVGHADQKRAPLEQVERLTEALVRMTHTTHAKVTLERVFITFISYI